MNDQIKKLVVYARQECHLCEEMIVALQSLQKTSQFQLEIVDIDLDLSLAKLYNERVPVLFAPEENKELCHYHLDLPLVSHYLSRN